MKALKGKILSVILKVNLAQTSGIRAQIIYKVGHKIANFIYIQIDEKIYNSIPREWILDGMCEIYEKELTEELTEEVYGSA
jgi:hypothetical protein